MGTWAKVNTPRILVIGEDRHLGTLLKNILSGAGYLAEQASSIEEASEIAADSSFDLALVDLRVSDDNGQVIQEAMQDDAVVGQFPWIALVDSSPAPAVPDGASGVVLLPVRVAEMLNAIRTTLRHSKAQPQTPAGVAEEDIYQLLARNLLEQKTLSDIARTLNSTLDLSTVLTKVVDAATLLTSAEEGLLLLPDDEGSELYVRAEKGIASATAQEFRIRTRDSLAGQVFESGKPLLTDSSDLHKLKTAYFVRSSLYVPLKSKNQTIGVLGINNRTTDRVFSDHDLALLEDLASHAAAAIENARLYEESVNRSKELSTLVEASEAVNSTLALDNVLEIIAEQLRNALNVNGCEIMAWDPDEGEVLSVLANHRRYVWPELQGPVLALEDYSEALAEVVEADQAYANAQHVSQVWLVPIKVNSRPVGILEFQYRTVAQDISPLVPRLQRIGMELIAEMVPDAVDILLEETGATGCRLWVVSNDHLYERFDFGYGIWLHPPQPTVELDNLPILGQALDKTRIVHVATNQNPDPLLNYYAAQTVVALPLVISGEVLGLTLLVNTSHVRAFEDRDISVAQALVTQAANALQNARLYDDLRNSLQELRRTQSKLVQSARMSAIGELAAAVAHQISNPLTTVLGDTEMLIEDRPEDDPDMEPLQAVHRAGQRAHEVVRRLLSMSRQGQEDVEPELMDINKTIHNTLSLVLSHIRRSQVDLQIELSEDLPQAIGLRGHLEDVWLNLLLNARDAVQEQPQPSIGIRSYQGSAHVCVDVWDNGHGIPEAQQADVFEAFFTTKASGEGTGLGLYICKQIVEKCSGEITIRSNQPHGVCFTVSLPTD